MKALAAITLVLCVSVSASAQGALVYDQQSSTDEISSFSPVRIQFYSSLGQSFTPSLSSIGFVILRLRDATPGNSLGATLVVNVRSNSMSGPILGTSVPVAFADSYNGGTNFLFESSVSVSPNATYFLDVLVQNGDDWGITTLGDTYSSGSFFGSGFPFLGADLWFREGIVVPEPGTGSFLLSGILGAVLLRHKQRRLH